MRHEFKLFVYGREEIVVKVWLWLMVLLAAFIISCAPGSYTAGPAAPEEVSQPKFYVNPETPEERTFRIWRESIGGGG